MNNITKAKQSRYVMYCWSIVENKKPQKFHS